MSTTFAQLALEFVTKNAAQAERETLAVERAGGRAEQQAEKLAKSTRKATDAMGHFHGGARKATDALHGMSTVAGTVGGILGKIAAVLGGGMLLGALIKTGDAWSDMQSKLGAAIKDMSAAPSMMERMIDIANASYSPLDQTVEVYSRNVGALRDLGKTAAQTADFTEALNHALVITATKGEAAASVQAALGKAMAVGKLTGDGLETILTHGGRAAEVFAKHLGTNVSGLRAMATAGKITGSAIATSLIAALEQLRAEAAEMPATVADGVTRIQTGVTALIGFMDQAVGGTGALAGVFVAIGDAIARAAIWAGKNGETIATVFNTLVGTAISAATAGAIYYAAVMGKQVVGSVIQAVTAQLALERALGATTTSSALASMGIKGLSTALAFLRSAIIATGIGALVVGAGYLVGKFMQLISATGSFGKAMTLLDEVAAGVWEGIKTGAEAIPAGLRSVWENVKADFFYMIADLGSGWANFLQMLGLGGAANGIREGVVTDYNKAGNDALEQAGTYAAAASAMLAEGWDKATSALEKLNITVEEADRKLTGDGGGGGVAGAAGKGKKALDDLRKEVEKLNKSAAMGRTPVEKYRAELAKLEQLKKLGLSSAAYSMELERINEELASSVPMIGSVADAFGEFVAKGFRDFKGFAKSILGTFQSMLAQMVATAAKKQIIFSMGFGGTAAAGGAALADGAGGAASGGLLGGLLSGIGSFGGALWGGAMNSLGALVSGGIGNMLGSIGAQVSTALAGATATSVGAALGAIAGPLAAVALVFSFFGKKTKELDRGLRVSVDGLSAFVEEFRTIETKRFWGLSKKVRTHYETAEQETQDAIGQAVAHLQSGILNAAKVLDFGADTFAGFAHTLEISTKDMKEDEALKAVQDAVMGLGDAFAEMVPGLKDQIQYGEGATEALERLANSLTGVRAVADLLGHRFDAAGLAGGVLADHLAQAFGGLDAMSSAVQTYWQAVYTEEERLETVTRQATEALAALGLQMPKSRAEYRAMVDALDLTQEGTHATYAALISLAGVFDQILPGVQGLTAALAELQGNAKTGLDGAIAAASEAAKANASAAASWYKAAGSIRDWIEKLRGTASPLTSPGQARANAEAAYQSTLARALAGDLQAAQDATGAADRLLAAVRATAQTQTEAAVAEARILSDMGLLAGVSDIEGARHDVIRGLLEQQVDAMTEVRDAIAAGAALTEAQVAALLGRLGELDDAIAAAELINYAYLRERLQVTVDVLADADVPEELRKLLRNAATGVEGYIDFLVRSDLTPDLKWLAMTGASQHVKTLRYLADNRLGADLTGLALQTVGQLQKTVNLLVGKRLDADTMRVALAGNSELARVVTATLAANISADAKKLALSGMSSHLVTIQAQLAAGNTAGQNRLLEMMGGATSGKLTLGGTFQFDPTTGFKTWYESTTQGQIAKPMADLTTWMAELRKSLNALRDGIAAEGARQAKAAEDARKIQDAQAAVAALAAQKSAAVGSLASAIDRVKAFDASVGGTLSYKGGAAQLGITADGRLHYLADAVSGASNADLQKWQAQFWGAGNLQDQMVKADGAVAAIDRQLEAARKAVRDLGGIPAFAAGGTHLGGLRIVGEHGPELEATGPSRIYSASQTSQMLGAGNAELVAELRALRAEVAELRAHSAKTAESSRDTVKLLKRVDQVGVKIDPDQNSVKAEA